MVKCRLVHITQSSILWHVRIHIGAMFDSHLLSATVSLESLESIINYIAVSFPDLHDETLRRAELSSPSCVSIRRCRVLSQKVRTTGNNSLDSFYFWISSTLYTRTVVLLSLLHLTTSDHEYISQLTQIIPNQSKYGQPILQIAVTQFWVNWNEVCDVHEREYGSKFNFS